MKKITLFMILISALLIGCSKSGTDDNLKWETNLETALDKAKQENKAVLVNFTGSDWCIWCQRLSDEVFSKDDFENFANGNLILVKLDFPKNIEQTAETKTYNNKLAQKYNIQGFPTILLFNSKGDMVLQTGYQPGGAAEYVNHLKGYL